MVSRKKAAGKTGNKKGRTVASGPGKVKSTKKTVRPPKPAPRAPRTTAPRTPRPAVPKPPAAAPPAPAPTPPTVPTPAPTAEHAARPHGLDEHTSEPMAGAGSEPSEILPPPEEPNPNSIT